MYDDIDRIRDLDGSIDESMFDGPDPREPITCPRCHGEGILFDNSDCPRCSGTGDIIPWNESAF